MGVLEAGSAASGMMYDSDDDMDIAKNKFRKLEDNLKCPARRKNKDKTLKRRAVN